MNETITQNLYFETMKSKVVILLFETIKLSVSISPRNLYNSLKSIKEVVFVFLFIHVSVHSAIHLLQFVLGFL